MLAGALDGIRVVSFGHFVAAPLAAMLLADQGADVLNIARPGALRRSPEAWRRGQRTLSLDLKSPVGLAKARGAALEADVVIENLRPGVLPRLGLGAEILRAANPGLVYCSMPGFSASDSARAGLAGWEGVVQAATAATHPWFEGATGREPPIFNPLPVASFFAALHGATAISAALYERLRSGEGQAIEVSLYAAMYSALGALGMRIHNVHTGPNQVINFVPLVREYECADGRWLQIHAFTRRAIRAFALVADVEDWIAEGVLRLGPVIADSSVRAELQARLEPLFRTRTAQEWEDALSTAGVSAAVCRTTAEWMRHPHARQSGLVVDGLDGKPEPAPLVELGTPGSVAPAPPTAPIDQPGTRPMLEGVRVLDLCIVLAGTTCGRTLAEYGADVIKIDDPHRDGGVIFHNDVNRGKRSILLDLKTDAGKQAFWRLLESADVVVENFRAGALERLGIGYEEVRKRRPEIVYVSLNTYGYRGPWAGRPGWEQLAEAATGMQVRYGGNGRPTLQPYAVLDFGTGLAAAYGAILALLQRARGGHGQRVTTSLAAAAGTLQSAFFGKPEAASSGGMDYLGPTWNCRYYRARDAWLFLAARPSQLEAVRGVARIEAGRTGPGDPSPNLETAFALQDAATWMIALQAAGIAATIVRSIADVMADPWAVEHGVSLQRDHPGMGLADTIGPVPQLARTPLQPGRPATFPGIDGIEVLREAGLSTAEIDALVADGVLVLPAGA